jgi:integrase
MLETGTRAGEVVALQTTDVDLANGRVAVRRGRGGKGRVGIAPPDRVRVPGAHGCSIAQVSVTRVDDARALGVKPKPLTYAGIGI